MPARAVEVVETLVVRGDSAVRELRAQFGIDAPRLMQEIAGALGITESRESLLDIPQTRGGARYNSVGVASREVMLPFGYERTNELPRIMLSPSREIAVALYFGDAGTGLADSSPSNAYAKGQGMSDLVAQNQGSLFPDLPFTMRRAPLAANDAEPTVWVLLVRVQARVVRAEFSLPCDEDGRGHINGWRRRYLLPEASLPDAYDADGEGAAPDLTSGPTFDIPVLPR